MARSDISAERRSQILQAALTCFMRSGYNKTTMDDIAAESGVSKGTLYWYFKSKNDLLQAVFLNFFEEAFGSERLAALNRLPTATAKLRALAQMMVALSGVGEGFFNLFLEFWASSTHRDEAAQLWTEMLVRYNDVLVGIIEEGVNSGEFQPVDAEGLSWAMMAAYDGLTAYLSLIPGLKMERVSDVFVETLLFGLTKRGMD